MPAPAGGESGVTDVTISTQTPGSNTALDTLPDARQSSQQGNAPAATAAKPETAPAQAEAQPAAKKGGKNSKNGKSKKQSRQNGKEKQ